MKGLGMKKLKFGAALNLVPAFLKTHDWKELRRLTLECEKFSYDSVWIMDHFGWDTGPNILECWTTLSALSAATSEIRLGTLVLCNSYRHPPLLAKMAATLDVISNGRLDFGIGAGWRQAEYEAAGIPFPSSGVRIAQLKEAIKVIKKIWTDKKSSYDGKYYSIHELDFGPGLVQKPYPPIWIGALGENLMLRLVAESANGWNITNQTPQQYAHKMEVLRKHCISRNRNIGEIMKSLLLPVVIDKSSEKAERKAKELKPPEISGDSFTTRLVGDPDECIEKIREYQNLGMTHFLIELKDMTDEERRLFAEEVIPAFK